MRQGFVTYDEMELIKDGLTALRDNYSVAGATPSIPKALRVMAQRKAQECVDLLNQLNKEPKMVINRD